MLDHVSLRVSDLPRALAFYKAALAPIGYAVGMEFPGGAGLGEPGKLDLWIAQTEKTIHPAHIAFRTDRASVDAFHAAALAAGGSDNGGPGVRTEYHPHYYAAFVIDPEGNNIEVVCHEAPGARKAAPSRAAARRPAKKIRKPARKPAKRAKRTTKPKKRR
jgi:catechol 2,3-dioxygenase-like lactoylglutathione lyase family enzyme